MLCQNILNHPLIHLILWDCVHNTFMSVYCKHPQLQGTLRLPYESQLIRKFPFTLRILISDYDYYLARIV